ncbi:MAG: hypothetical protein K2X82_29765 [Gemmataceae bacterium]|nr:hypothetical protein [Gemmataceae bacterium]
MNGTWLAKAFGLMLAGGVVAGLTGPADRGTAAPVTDRPANLDPLWADLAKDEPEASRALLVMAARPGDVVPYLKEKLRPLKTTPERVRKLSKDLGSNDEGVWKPAYEEFEYLDPRLAVDLVTLVGEVTDAPARPRLVAVLSGHSVGHANDLVGDTIELSPIQGGDGYNFRAGGSWWAEHKVERLGTSISNRKAQWVRAVRAVNLLEHIGTPAAVAVIREMATGHPDALPTKTAKRVVERIDAAKPK